MLTVKKSRSRSSCRAPKRSCRRFRAGQSPPASRSPAAPPCRPSPRGGSGRRRASPCRDRAAPSCADGRGIPRRGAFPPWAGRDKWAERGVRHGLSLASSLFPPDNIAVPKANAFGAAITPHAAFIIAEKAVGEKIKIRASPHGKIQPHFPPPLSNAQSFTRKAALFRRFSTGFHSPSTICPRAFNRFSTIKVSAQISAVFPAKIQLYKNRLRLI